MTDLIEVLEAEAAQVEALLNRLNKRLTLTTQLRQLEQERQQLAAQAEQAAARLDLLVREESQLAQLPAIDAGEINIALARLQQAIEGGVVVRPSPAPTKATLPVEPAPVLTALPTPVEPARTGKPAPVEPAAPAPALVDAVDELNTLFAPSTDDDIAGLFDSGTDLATASDLPLPEFPAESGEDDDELDDLFQGAQAGDELDDLFQGAQAGDELDDLFQGAQQLGASPQKGWWDDDDADAEVEQLPVLAGEMEQFAPVAAPAAGEKKGLIGRFFS